MQLQTMPATYDENSELFEAIKHTRKTAERSELVLGMIVHAGRALGTSQEKILDALEYLRDAGLVLSDRDQTLVDEALSALTGFQLSVNSAFALVSADRLKSSITG